MGSPITVSVIIPAFNAERYLSDAIRSVLAQDHQPLELLVIDDGSSDDTARIARSFGAPVVCWSGPRGGAAAARNNGIARARGELIAFLDADDLWAEGKLTRQCAVLADDETVEAVFGHVQVFTELPSQPRQLGAVLPGPASGTMLIRASALRRVGPYNPKVSRAEALDWYLKAQAANLRQMMLPDVLMYRRVHGNNCGIVDRDAQRSEYFRVLRSALEQKRRLRESSSDGA